jgi:hypothetical protein
MPIANITLPVKIEGFYIDATDYGLSTSGTGAANRDALANALATNQTVFVPKGTYFVTGSVDVNLGVQSFIGDDAILDFSANTGTTVAFNVGGNSGLAPGDLVPAGSYPNKFSGFVLLGDGKAGSGAAASSTTVGLKVNAAHVSFMNVIVYGFGTGISIGTSGYIQSYYHVSVGQCAIGVLLVADAIDYAERVSFVNCTIYDNILGISNNSNVGGLYFTNCSIDYNVKTLDATNQAVTELHNTWVETIDAGAGNVQMTLSGGALFNMFGGRIMQNGPGGAHTQAGLFHTDASTVRMSNVFMFNTKNTANVLDSGSGNVWIEGTSSYGVSLLPTKLSPNGGNKLSDPSFEAASIQDYWTITNDTAPITNRFSGTNVSIALSSTYAHSGSQSLRITKGAGAALGGVSLLVPAKPGSRMGFTGHYKLPAASPECYISQYAVYVPHTFDTNVPNIGKTLLFDTIGIGNSASPIDWTEIGTGMDRVIPSWANYYLIDINIYFLSGDLYLDDFYVNAL